MARYFFHIRQDILLEDLDGADYPDLEAARLAAIADVRDLIAERIKLGRAVEAYAIEISDGGQMPVATVTFRDVLKELAPWL
jgi:hypothetical protein